MDSKLFDDVKDMLNGYFKHKKGEIRFISKTRKKGKFDIPLHLASSSARGLTDLYFFLKHVAREGQLLIIDEPESHLNTENYCNNRLASGFNFFKGDQHEDTRHFRKSQERRNIRREHPGKNRSRKHGD